MRVFDAVAGYPWAIKPEWLHFIAAAAQRAVVSAPVERPTWAEPESLHMVGGTLLEGARRTIVRDGVAVVPIMGPLMPRANAFEQISGATSLQLLALDLGLAARNPDVKSILLEVDSPGGSAFGPGEFADLVRETAQSKRVVAYVGGMAASAAYWVASATDEIVANKGAMLGSIGTVVRLMVQEGPDRDGFRDFEIVSGNAENKRPDPREDSGLEEIRREIDAIEAIFLEAVARNRNMSVEQVIEAGRRGGVQIGADAVRAGLADRIGTFEDVLAELAGRGAAAGGQSAMNRKEESMAQEKTGQPAPDAKPAEAAAATPTAADTAPLAAAAAAADDGEITLEELEAAVPDLITQIRSQAATAERERILAIQAKGERGLEGLIAECVKDPDCTPDQASSRVLEAVRARRAKHLQDMQQEDPAKLQAAPQPGGEAGATPDPREIGEQARALVDSERKAGRTMTYAQAARRVVDGERAA